MKVESHLLYYLRIITEALWKLSHIYYIIWGLLLRLCESWVTSIILSEDYYWGSVKVESYLLYYLRTVTEALWKLSHIYYIIWGLLLRLCESWITSIILSEDCYWGSVKVESHLLYCLRIITKALWKLNHIYYIIWGLLLRLCESWVTSSILSEDYYWGSVKVESHLVYYLRIITEALWKLSHIYYIIWGLLLRLCESWITSIILSEDYYWGSVKVESHLLYYLRIITEALWKLSHIYYIIWGLLLRLCESWITSIIFASVSFCWVLII